MKKHVQHAVWRKILWAACLNLPVVIAVSGQQEGIPDWYFEDLSTEAGLWCADNRLYQSEDEPYDSYCVEWKMGIHHNTLHGYLYGRKEGLESPVFWEFLKYWDPQQGKPVLMQIAQDGTLGRGPFQNTSRDSVILHQIFSSPLGGSRQIGHREQYLDKHTKQGSSFLIKADGQWVEDRTYTWKKEKPVGRIFSRIDSSQVTDWVLIQEMEVDAPVREVWKAYTTKEGYQNWAAPLAEVDLRPGGTIRTNYNKHGQIGDSTTIVTHILNLVPEKLLTLQAELGNNFPDFMKKEEKGFYNIITFESINPGKTRVCSYGTGYKNTPRFRALMQFFIAGNEATMLALLQYLEQ